MMTASHRIIVHDFLSFLCKLKDLRAGGQRQLVILRLLIIKRYSPMNSLADQEWQPRAAK